MEFEGEEVDTKAFIQAKRVFNFYLPSPTDNDKTREKDEDFHDKLKNLNTLSLIDFDTKYGNLYIANAGHISVLRSPYLLSNSSNVGQHLVHLSVGFDQSYIKCVKAFYHKNKAFLLVISEATVKIFRVDSKGSINSLDYEFNLADDKTVQSIDIADVNGQLMILIVDASNKLNLLNFDKKTLTYKNNIRSGTFAFGTILCISEDGTQFFILDALNLNNKLAEPNLSIDEMKEIKFCHGKSIFIFYSDAFYLTIFDFEAEITRKTLIEFSFINKTNFEESFSPSDNMLDDQSALYWMQPIIGTNYIFSTCSFAESADVFYQTEDEAWAKSAPEVQSLRMLAPSDLKGCICSFKGIAYYPFKFSEEEKDTCSYKFTDEEMQVAFPKKIITLSYSGRVDVFECYFRDIQNSNNILPKESSEEVQEEEEEKIPFDLNQEFNSKASFCNNSFQIDHLEISFDEKSAGLKASDGENKSWNQPFNKLFEKSNVESKSKEIEVPTGFKMMSKSEELENIPKNPFMANSFKNLTKGNQTEINKDNKISQNAGHFPFGTPKEPLSKPSLEEVKTDVTSHKHKVEHKQREKPDDLNKILKEVKTKTISKIKNGEKTSAEFISDRIRKEKLEQEIKQKKLEEEKEGNYLKSINDPFRKTLLTAQYDMANQINKVFKEFPDIILEENENSHQYLKAEVDIVKSELSFLSFNRDIVKLEISEFMKKLKEQYRTNEKLQSYWDTAQKSEILPFKEICSRLGENNIFTREIQKIQTKSDLTLEKTQRFIDIIDDYTNKSESLNKILMNVRQSNL